MLATWTGGLAVPLPQAFALEIELQGKLPSITSSEPFSRRGIWMTPRWQQMKHRLEPVDQSEVMPCRIT